MARLFSNLLSSLSGRFYFALDSSPNAVTPGVATLTLHGRTAALSDQSIAFRNPATAVLTLNGLALSSPSLLSPATAALSALGRQPDPLTSLTVIVAAPTPVEADEATYEPTLITEMTVSPTQAALTLNYLELNVSQGGNIGFVAPSKATLTFSVLAPILGFQPELATITLVGLAPSLTLNSVATLTPDPATLTCVGSEPTLSIPFIWIDDDPAPPVTWIDDPRS